MNSTEKVTATSVTAKRSQSSATRTVVIFIAGCAIGALTMSSFSSSPANTTTTTTTTATTTTETPAATATSTGAPGTTSLTSGSDAGLATGTFTNASASGDVSVSNQPAGASVLVDSVTVPPPGVWVAVQETHGDTLGNVLGATRVHGPLSNVVVSLLRNTVPNHTYAVVLYRDGGDGGGFNLNTDSVYVDFDSGKRVVAPFQTTAAVATTTAS